jgi:hypothetical protein
MTQIHTNFSSARELIGKSNSPEKNDLTVLSFKDVQEEMRSIFSYLDDVLRSRKLLQDVSFSNNNYEYFIRLVTKSFRARLASSEKFELTTRQ